MCSIASLRKDIKSIVSFFAQTQEKNIELFIKKENLVSGSQLGKYALTSIIHVPYL